MRVVKFGHLCSISWRARPKRRRWQTRARPRSLSVTHWPSARASTTHTATGDTEPAGNRNLQPVYYYITALWFLIMRSSSHPWLQELCIHMKSSVHLPCLSNVGLTGQTGLLSILIQLTTLVLTVFLAVATVSWLAEVLSGCYLM